MNAVKPLSQLQKQSDPKIGNRGSALAVLVALVLFITAIVLILNRQAVVDQLTVWQFVPSADITAIAKRADMSDKGIFYLYASQPQLDDKASFNRACGSLQNEKTVIIGCYTDQQKRIYIYNVTDTKLDGVKETTAAHEMLHAAYDRLSDKEKARVDSLLEQQKGSIIDPRLLKLIDYYEEAEPTTVVNELHSIFGTEVRNLSPELETYYKQYFSNRLTVVGLKERYEKIFTDLADQQTQLVREMNILSADVNVRQTAYQTTLSVVNADIASFNTWARSQTASKADYATRRASLQLRIDALDAERDAVNAEIDTYNQLKSKLDKLNVQAAGLNHSIDSKIESTSTLQD